MRSALVTACALSMALVSATAVSAEQAQTQSGTPAPEVKVQKPAAPQVPALAPAPATLPPRTEEGLEVRQVITFGCLRRKGLNDWVLVNAVEAVPLVSEDQKIRRVAVPGQLGLPVLEVADGGIVRPEIAKPVPPRDGQPVPAEKEPNAQAAAPQPAGAKAVSADPAPSGPSTELTPDVPPTSPILTDLPVGKFTYDLVAASIFSPKVKTDQTVQITGVLLRLAPTHRINVSTMTTLADRCAIENSRSPGW